MPSQRWMAGWMQHARQPATDEHDGGTTTGTTGTTDTTDYTTYTVVWMGGRGGGQTLHFAPASEQLSCAVVEPDEPDDEEEAITSPERLPPATVSPLSPFTLRL